MENRNIKYYNALVWEVYPLARNKYSTFRQKKQEKFHNFLCTIPQEGGLYSTIHLVIQPPFAPPGIGAEIYKTGVIGPNDEHQTGKAGQQRPYELCQDQRSAGDAQPD